MDRTKLKQLIDNSELSQNEIIRRANITRPTLTAIYNGSDPRISIIESLARVLNVSPAVFFDGSENNTQPKEPREDVDSITPERLMNIIESQQRTIENLSRK